MYKHIQPMQGQDKIDQLTSFYRRVSEANLDYFTYWKHETFLHWDFWTSVALSVLPWMLWWFLHERSSRARLLAVGMFMIIITSWLDFLGSVFGLWIYTGKTLPTIPCFLPWDFSVFPVIVMLLIQYKPKVKPWKKALLFSLGCALIGEPLFIWVGFYIPLKWDFFYSIPIYFVIYLTADRIAKAKSYAFLEKETL